METSIFYSLWVDIHCLKLLLSSPDISTIHAKNYILYVRMVFPFLLNCTIILPMQAKVRRICCSLLNGVCTSIIHIQFIPWSVNCRAALSVIRWAAIKSLSKFRKFTPSASRRLASFRRFYSMTNKSLIRPCAVIHSPSSDYSSIFCAIHFCIVFFVAVTWNLKTYFHWIRTNRPGRSKCDVLIDASGLPKRILMVKFQSWSDFGETQYSSLYTWCCYTISDQINRMNRSSWVPFNFTFYYRLVHE